MGKCKYRFVVNSLGEPVRDGELVGKSVNINEVAEACFSPRELRTWRTGRRSAQLEKKLEPHVGRAIREEARATMNAREYSFWTDVVRLQAVNNARFRAWGELTRSSSHVWLVTEFRTAADNRPAWAYLRGLADPAPGDAKLFTMWEGEENDEVSRDGGKTWVRGPKHGRLLRQVEMRWEIGRNWRVGELRGYIAFLARCTEAAWQAWGVNVL